MPKRMATSKYILVCSHIETSTQTMTFQDLPVFIIAHPLVRVKRRLLGGKSIPPPAKALCGLLALKLQRRQAGRPDPLPLSLTQGKGEERKRGASPLLNTCLAFSQSAWRPLARIQPALPLDSNKATTLLLCLFCFPTTSPAFQKDVLSDIHPFLICSVYYSYFNRFERF